MAHRRAQEQLIHQGDFFSWAGETKDRFECTAGNPPFIRYQRFTGDVRRRAIRLSQAHGADLHGPRLLLGAVYVLRHRPC